MRELGDLTEQEHRLLAGYVQQSADQICLVGESMELYLFDELQKIGIDGSAVYLSRNSKEV